jgi:TPR repeat protein
LKNIVVIILVCAFSQSTGPLRGQDRAGGAPVSAAGASTQVKPAGVNRTSAAWKLGTGRVMELGSFATNESFARISEKEIDALTAQAEKGDTRAQYELAFRYFLGISVGEDANRAVEWLKKAAGNGEPRAQRRLGEIMLKTSESDRPAGLQWLRKAAEAGDAAAAFELGDAYMEGSARLTVDDAQAFHWLLKAAQEGLAPAQYQVGIAYAQGRGVPTNADVAREWFEKAAAQDNPPAMFLLGSIYVEGNGVPHNGEEAVRWFTKSALGGNMDAQTYLGVCFAKGDGVPKDIQEAEDLLEGAAMAGNAWAADQLGNIFVTITQNLPMAFAWFSRGAAEGYAVAESDLGLMLQRGWGVTNDEVEAMKWFDLSADQGDKRGTIFRDDFSVLLDASEKQEARKRADAFQPQIIRGGIDSNFNLTASLGDELQIPVRILGETKHLILDTGSDSTCLDRAFAPRLGKPLASTPVTTLLDTETNSPVYRCPELYVGDSEIAPLWTACGDFELIRIVCSDPCDGVLGMNWLQNYIFIFDSDKNAFSVSQSVSHDATENTLVNPVKMATAGTFTFRINGIANGNVPISFEIDTGDSGSISLDLENWERVFPSEPTNVHSAPVAGVGPRLEQEKMTRLAKLQVGTNFYTNLIVLCAPGLPSRLGASFVRRHVLTVDYPNQVLYLKPGKAFAKPEDTDMSGLSLVRKDGKTLASRVDQDSPAFRAGVRENDKIVSINGQMAASMKLRTVRNLLATGPGDKITLEIERTGQRMTIGFSLVRFI